MEWEFFLAVLCSSSSSPLDMHGSIGLWSSSWDVDGSCKSLYRRCSGFTAPARKNSWMYSDKTIIRYNGQYTVFWYIRIFLTLKKCTYLLLFIRSIVWVCFWYLLGVVHGCVVTVFLRILFTELTLGTDDGSQFLWDSNRSLISHANIPGFSCLHLSILLTTEGVATCLKIIIKTSSLQFFWMCW